MRRLLSVVWFGIGLVILASVTLAVAVMLGWRGLHY